MKRGLLIGGGVIGAVIVVVIALIVFVFANIDSVVKTAVEEVGSEVTEVKVTLDKVDISAFSGKGTLAGLIVGNPPGYKTKHAISLGAVSVDIDTDTIGEDTIVIREVRIEAPDITYELGDGGSNVQVIQNNVASSTGGSKSSGGKKSGGGEPGGGGKTTAAGQGPKIIIENLYIDDGEIAVSAPFLQGKEVSASLPDIHLRDIGKSSGGVTSEEVVDTIMSAITSGVGKSVASLNIDGLIKDTAAELKKKALEEAQKKLGGDLSKQIESFTKGSGGIDKKVEEEAGKAVESLKKLFGN